MRTTKSLTISLPPAQLRDMERTAKKENRQFTVDPIRAQRLLQLKQVVSELRNEASQTGASKLTTRQINAEIEAYRQQKQTSKTKQPLRYSGTFSTRASSIQPSSSRPACRPRCLTWWLTDLLFLASHRQYWLNTGKSCWSDLPSVRTDGAPSRF